MHSEFFLPPVTPRETDGRVSGDSTLAVSDLIDPTRWSSSIHGHPVPPYPEAIDEDAALHQHSSGRDRLKHVGISGNRQVRYLPSLQSSIEDGPSTADPPGLRVVHDDHPRVAPIDFQVGYAGLRWCWRRGSFQFSQGLTAFESCEVGSVRLMRCSYRIRPVPFFPKGLVTVPSRDGERL